MEQVQYAFINEVGNYGFNFTKKDVSTHFIVVAILVKEENKEFLEQQLNVVWKRYELKKEDSEVDFYHNILNDIKDLPFHIYAYVIDKRKISDDSGIHFKSSFFKRLNRMLFDDLSRTFELLDITVSERESLEYMQEFKSYIQKRSIPDLFNYSSFGINNSQSDSILKLAHVIADTLAMGYDITQKSSSYKNFIPLFREKVIRINLWPVEYKSILYKHITESTDFVYDELISQQAIQLALHYIEKNKRSNDIDEKERIDFLNYLLYKLHENPNQYVYTAEILDNLNAIRDNQLNSHYLRSNIVSKLRDAGVLISSSIKGYKLPVSLEDIYDFVNMTNSTINPMLKRISKCREQILLASNNEIDIFEKEEFIGLKRMIDMENSSIY